MMLSSQITFRGGFEVLNQALRWWFGELAEILNMLSHLRQEKPLEFEVSNKNVLILQSDEKVVSAGGKQNITLRFIDNAVLYRKIKLPAAAHKNIKKVIGYEFSKYFPMDVDAALVSCHIIQPGAAAESIEVEIWAINRSIVDAYLSEIRQQYNFKIKKLEITNSNGDVLISEDVLKAQKNNERLENPRAGKLLNGIIALLLLALLIYAILKLNWLVESLQEDIVGLEKEAKPVIEVRDKILEMEKRFQYLISKKKQYPDQAFIWSHITKTVSSKAILDRMIIKGENVQLEGKAPSVERLIRTLESDHGISNVKIIGPVTTTNDDLYETMKISMTVNP